jgi:hypothetical protein
MFLISKKYISSIYQKVQRGVTLVIGSIQENA